MKIAVGHLLVFAVSLALVSAMGILAFGRQTVHHDGDLVIEAGGTVTLEDVTYYQHGNITVRDNGRLVVRNARLVMEESYQGETSFTVQDTATLEMDSVDFYFEWGCIGAYNSASLSLRNVRGSHFDITATDSSVVSAQACTFWGFRVDRDAVVAITDSTISGYLYMGFGTNANVQLAGLREGRVGRWSLGANAHVQNVHLDISVTNSYVDGWSIGISESATVVVTDSSLFEIVLTLEDAGGSFAGLKTGVFPHLEVSASALTGVGFALTLDNTSVKEWWRFSLYGRSRSDVQFVDSVIHLYLSGATEATVLRSTVLFLVAADYHGTVSFEDSTIEDACLFFLRTDCLLVGSVRFVGSPHILTWQSAHVTREYEVVVTDKSGRPVANLPLDLRTSDGTRVSGGVTAADGTIILPLLMGDADHESTWQLFVRAEGRDVQVGTVDFTTESPVPVTWEPR